MWTQKLTWSALLPCNGCPGGNVESAGEEMVKNGAEVIHLATGMLSAIQQMEFTTTDGKKRLAKAASDIDLPLGFPEKYRYAIVKATGLCSVKKVIMDPPEFVIAARMVYPNIAPKKGKEK